MLFSNRWAGPSQLDCLFIEVAPHPPLSRLDAAGDRVAAGLVVPGGVPILRRIATTYQATLETHSEVHPGVPHRRARFTIPGRGLREGADRGQVTAYRG